MTYIQEPHKTLEELLRKYSLPYLVMILYEVADKFISIDNEYERNETKDRSRDL